MNHGTFDSGPQLDSFMRNCRVISRDDAKEGFLFELRIDENGNTVVRCRLDGYTIVPNEVYDDFPKSLYTPPPSPLTKV